MYSLKNDDIYNKTIDFIFSFDKNSNILNINMIKGLFEFFNYKTPSDDSLKYFIDYYGTDNLVRDILKKKDQSENFDEDFIKNNFKNYENDGKLDINKFYNDIVKLNKDINKDDFTKFVNSVIFKNSDNNINTFYDYILNLLK